MSLTFIVPGEVVPWQRARVQRRGAHLHFLTADKVTNYKALVKMMAAAAVEDSPEWPALDGAVEVELRVFRPIPKAFSKKRRALALQGLLRPSTKPDVDNTVKGIFDALNGVAWRDDAQVSDLVVRKRYADEPRVEVHLSHAPTGTESVM